MREEFRLQGWRYWQAFRRCGKDNCVTCQKGKGHGPYWYRRHRVSGRREYVGKELPVEVRQVRLNRGMLVSGARVVVDELKDEMLVVGWRLRAVQMFVSGEGLTDEQMDYLTDVGFGTGLVVAGTAGRAQD